MVQSLKVFRAFNEGQIVVVYPFVFFVDITTDAFNVVAVGHLVMQPCQGVEAFIVLGLTVVAASALFMVLLPLASSENLCLAGRLC